MGFLDWLSLRRGSNYYRLSLISDKTWTFGYVEKEEIASGALDNLPATMGDEISVELLAQGKSGAFAVLGAEIAELDLGDVLDTGGIWIAAAAYVADTDLSRTIEYSKFEVFTLE